MTRDELKKHYDLMIETDKACSALFDESQKSFDGRLAWDCAYKRHADAKAAYQRAFEEFQKAEAAA